MLALEAELPLRAIELSLRLEVQSGETLALAGASGAGKTTCLRLIAGFVRPRRGRVVCAGEVWLDTDGGISRPPESRRCGYLFQEYALFPHLRAWQNVAYGLTDLPRGGEGDYRHTSRAVSTTSRSFAHWSSSSIRLPSMVEAKPHWGLSARFSRGT